MIVEAMGALEKKAGGAAKVSPVVKALGYVFALLMALLVWVLLLVLAVVLVASYFLALFGSRMALVAAGFGLRLEKEAQGDVLLCFERLSSFSKELLGVGGTELENSEEEQEAD